MQVCRLRPLDAVGSRSKRRASGSKGKTLKPGPGRIGFTGALTCDMLHIHSSAVIAALAHAALCFSANDRLVHLPNRIQKTSAFTAARGRVATAVLLSTQSFARPAASTRPDTAEHFLPVIGHTMARACCGACCRACSMCIRHDHSPRLAVVDAALQSSLACLARCQNFWLFCGASRP